MPGVTPYCQLRYPLPGETVDATALQNLATDINTKATAINTLQTQATKRPFATARLTGSPSVVKATNTTVTWAAPSVDTGTFWNAGSPTRFTAAVAGTYYFVAYVPPGQVTGGTSATVRTLLCKNGSNVPPNYIMGNFTDTGGTNSPSGAYGAIAQGMYRLIAGDFMTVVTWWTGSLAGPITFSSGLFTAQLISY